MLLFLYNKSMDNRKALNSYLKLANTFKENGFSLYLIGSASRDFLLKKEIMDLDVVSDATPLEMQTFLSSNDMDTSFIKYGVIKYKVDEAHFDIVTLRKEKAYKDFRHPSKIKFIKSLKKDHLRRDFTINAIYIDDRFNIIDFENGVTDLNNKVIRMIGNPIKRIKEDPLRILRAIRFSLLLDFEIEQKLEKAINKKIALLKDLNKEKIKQELKKMENASIDKKIEIFKRFNILYLLDMIK